VLDAAVPGTTVLVPATVLVLMFKYGNVTFTVSCGCKANANPNVKFSDSNGTFGNFGAALSETPTREVVDRTDPTHIHGMNPSHALQLAGISLHCFIVGAAVQHRNFPVLAVAVAVVVDEKGAGILMGKVAAGYTV
jgi:hypothetical protein